MTTTELAKGYLKYYRSERTCDFPGFNDVISLCANTETAVGICVALAEECNSNHELSYIAAGPYEDVLKLHGTERFLQRGCGYFQNDASGLKWRLD